MKRIDWVSKRAIGTAQEVFKCLLDEFRYDIERVNELDLPRFGGGKFEFELTSNDSCKVYWKSLADGVEKSGPAVIIRCMNDVVIEVFRLASSVCASELGILKIVVDWDFNESECILKQGSEDKALQPWEVSQLALHHLFFDSMLD